MTRADKEQLGADLSAYLDGELSPERTREIEELLAQSATARELLEQLRAVSRRLGELPHVRAPDGSVAEALRQYEKTHGSNAKLSRSNRVHMLWRISRVVASAAVITLCFYTGWFMHARYAPSQVDTERAEFSAARARETIDSLMETNKERPAGPLALGEKAAPSPESRPEIPSAIANALESLGYVDGGEDVNKDESLDLAVIPPADAFEPRQPAADQIAGKDVAHDQLAPTEQSDDFYPTAAQPIAWASAATTIQVYVTPQDGEQYAAALQAVASWQGMERHAGLFAMSAVAEKSDNPVATSTRQVTMQVLPEAVGGLLSELERQVPRQVNVALNFRPEALAQVKEIVSPAPLGMPLARRLHDERLDAPAVAEAAPPPPTASMRPALDEQPKALAARTYELEKQDDARRTPAQQVTKSPESKRNADAEAADLKEPKFRARINTFESSPDREDAPDANGRVARRGRAAGHPAKKYAPDRQPTVADVARSASEKLEGQPFLLSLTERETPAFSPTPASPATAGSTGVAPSASPPACATADISAPSKPVGEPAVEPLNVTISINILPPPTATQPTTRPATQPR